MQRAFVMINCDGGSEKSLIEKLKCLDDVKEVCGTLGPYDIIAKLEAQKIEAIRETITWKIRRLDHVRSTLTLIGMEEVSREKKTAELIPDLIPEEKKPKEPPSWEDVEEEEEEEYEEDESRDKDEKN